MRNGYWGGGSVQAQSLTRWSAGWSMVVGVTPAPSEAERLRSSTELLLPSQCSHMPCGACGSGWARAFWFHSEGKSEAPISSSCGSLASGQLNWIDL